jgi:hypothetical protein
VSGTCAVSGRGEASAAFAASAMKATRVACVLRRVACVLLVLGAVGRAQDGACASAPRTPAQSQHAVGNAAAGQRAAADLAAHEALQKFLAAHARPPVRPTMVAPPHSSGQRTNVMFPRTNMTATNSARVPASPTAKAIAATLRVAPARTAAAPMASRTLQSPPHPTSVLGGAPSITTSSRAARIDATAMHRKF